AVGTTRATWLVDGDTLEGARALAVGAPTAPGTSPGHAEPDATAASWLQRVADAAGTGDVRALPSAGQANGPLTTACPRRTSCELVSPSAVATRTSADSPPPTTA